MNLSQDAAETLALQALAWLAENDDVLQVFMGSTGAGVDDLRERAGDPVFLASVLEFLTMDDQWVVGFCDTHGQDYMAPMMAAQVLQGEGRRHWT